MEHIKAYKLSDGTIVENKDEAAKLEKEISFKRKLEAFSDREGCYFEYSRAIQNAINDNRDEIREMLNGLL